MNNYKALLLPVARHLMAPRRNFFSRRLPYVEISNMERTFDRMERDINETRFGRFGPPIGVQSLFQPNSKFFPVIQGETSVSQNGGKYLVKMELGKEFNPENVKVSLKNRVLKIEAKFEQKSEDGNSRVYQEISRSFTLPENTEEVKSLLTPEGELLIEAPLTEKDVLKPKEIPISVESN